MNMFNPHEYYKRQEVLKELGEVGQRRLKNSKVLIAGIGGLGSISSLYLALAGVGRLILVDRDVVDVSNLHRQVLYSFNDVRLPKVEAAARRLKELNPEVEVEAIAENINGENVFNLVRKVDCVVDGLDNMRTRYLINKACVKNNIPYIFAGAIGFEGNISVIIPHETACLQCFLPDLNDASLPTCETRGVIGATPGIIGAMEAMEAIKLLAGIDGGLKGKLLVCDFVTMNYITVDLKRNPNCKVCGEGSESELEMEVEAAVLCGSDTVNVNPDKNIRVDLDEAQRILASKYELLISSSLAITLKYRGDIEITIFRNGRMLIRNVGSVEEALKIYRDLMKILPYS